MGYIIVGSTLATAEMVTNTQKDVAQQIEQRLHTNIEITDAKIINESHIEISLKNIGQEPIKDFDHMDVKTFNLTKGYEQNSWTFINPGTLDSGESINLYARYETQPDKVTIITGNGITATHLF